MSAKVFKIRTVIYHLSPWLAALFHHISSVLVVLNSARPSRNKGTDGSGIAAGLG